MKVLLLNGSARKGGCTARALKEVEEVLQAEGIEDNTVEPTFIVLSKGVLQKSLSKRDITVPLAPA